MRPTLRSLRRGTGAAVLALLVTTLAATARAAVYDLTDLGSALGPGAVPTGINDAGQIVGRYGTPEGTRPFIYHNGTVTNLGAPPGAEVGDAAGVFGEAISSNGLVAGTSFTRGARPRALLFQNGTVTELPEPAGSTGSGAFGINSSGSVVGYVQDASSMQFPARWDNGVLTTLAPPNSTGGFAHAINDAGAIVGRYQPSTSVNQQAFVYQDGTYTVLPTLGGKGASARALNDVGGVAGNSEPTSGEEHAVYYVNGQLIDLGTLGGRYSSAIGVNNSGVVVGAYEPAGTQRPHGFVYRDGQMFDLNDLIDPSEGFVIETVRGINNSGQIVGTGRRVGDFTDYAFVLTPIPEPAGAVTAVAALALMTLRRRRGA